MGSPKPEDEARNERFGPYTLAVHALGFSGFSRFLFRNTNVIEYFTYSVAHPTIPESVLNYDDQAADRANWITSGYKEPDCSPHPFDVMAIYALYQSP